MQLIPAVNSRAQKIGCSLLGGMLFVVCVSSGASAQSALADPEATYLYRFFSDADDVHVRSHFGFYGTRVGETADLTLRYNHERITVPGVAAPPGSDEAIDAITTASRPIAGSADAYSDFTKVRNEVTATLEYRSSTVGYYVSSESDYFAQQLNGTYTHAFFQENLYLSGGMSYGWDAITPLADFDTSTPDDFRNTFHANLVLTQLLTPTTQFRVGVEASRVRGLMHNPYRNVYAGGGNVPEVHPGERVRRDGFVRIQQYLSNRSSLEFRYRLYGDDWGVRSQTYGARLHQYVGHDAIVRYRYRYYDQGGADFYRSDYADAGGVEGFLTGDYRLRPTSSHLFGAMLDLSLRTFTKSPRWVSQTRMTLSYERYFNDYNFSANVFETGLRFQF